MCKFIDGDFFESLFGCNFNTSSSEGLFQNKPEFVFASTDSIIKLIDFIHRSNPNFSFTLVTHNADSTISMEGSQILYHHGLNDIVPPIEIDLPAQIRRWYSQNLDIKNDDFFVSLPIGMERKRWSGGYKHDAMSKLIHRQKKEKEHLVYSNYLTRNNPLKRNINLKHVNCFYRDRCVFDVYANDIMNSVFVLCPVGNGLDTHRAWESLYLGSYPIVENNHCNQAIFEGLPVLLVDDFNSLTTKMLKLKRDEMQSKEINMEKLTQQYYIDLIFGSKNDTSKKLQRTGS